MIPKFTVRCTLYITATAKLLVSYEAENYMHFAVKTDYICVLIQIKILFLDDKWNVDTQVFFYSTTFCCHMKNTLIFSIR